MGNSKRAQLAYADNIQKKKKNIKYPKNSIHFHLPSYIRKYIKIRKSPQ